MKIWMRRFKVFSKRNPHTSLSSIVSQPKKVVVVVVVLCIVVFVVFLVGGGCANLI